MNNFDDVPRDRRFTKVKRAVRRKELWRSNLPVRCRDKTATEGLVRIRWRLLDFNARLDWLQHQGYHSITMTELFDAFSDGKALHSRPMILTFDGGYADAYTNALPALLAHYDRGVFYFITGMVGGNFMTWAQVQALARSGMQIASHTVHHVNVGSPPAPLTPQEELLASKKTLEAGVAANSRVLQANKWYSSSRPLSPAISKKT